MITRLFSLLMVTVTFSVNAETASFSNDSYVAGAAVEFQADFQLGEIAAARFVPEIECPCLVTDVSLLFGGAVDSRTIGIKIWQDPDGQTEPGTLLIHDFRNLAASDDTIQTVDMSASSVIVNGPFRVGIQFLQLDLPAVSTDTDGNINNNANFILKSTNGIYNWSPAILENMNGDFVIRASIDNVVLADIDNDGFANETDNCVDRFNPEQRDTDNDSIGNLCDADVAKPNDCVVNFLDFAVYRDNFKMIGNLDTDNNGDGVTNFIDFALFANYFLAQPGPSATGCDNP